MTNNKKLAIHIVIFLIFFLLAMFTFMPIITYIDDLIEWDFTHTMFAFGILLGLIYIALEILAYLFKNNETLAYYFKITPSIFVLSGFLWYFYTFTNKIISETKEDVQYFQAVVLAFSIFFLLVKITREVKTIRKNF